MAKYSKSSYLTSEQLAVKYPFFPIYCKVWWTSNVNLTSEQSIVKCTYVYCLTWSFEDQMSISLYTEHYFWKFCFLQNQGPNSCFMSLALPFVFFSASGLWTVPEAHSNHLCGEWGSFCGFRDHIHSYGHNWCRGPERGTHICAWAETGCEVWGFGSGQWDSPLQSDRARHWNETKYYVSMTTSDLEKRFWQTQYPKTFFKLSTEVLAHSTGTQAEVAEEHLNQLVVYWYLHYDDMVNTVVLVV